MKLIVAADIFGKTPALKELADNISSHAAKVAIIDPYSGRSMDFADEETAYTYFQKNVGIRQYRDRIFGLVERSGRDLHLVGFSVGASAIWALSGDLSTEKNIHAIGFYGSQIRYYVDVEPNIPVALYFPCHEPQFDVSDLMSQLSSIDRVTCSMVPYSHGFMNRKSRNFDASGYARYLEVLRVGSQKQVT